MRLPEQILTILREREGLEWNDTSNDVHFNNMTPRKAFQEMCIWEFGSSTYAGWFITTARDCGFTVEVSK